jgi:hypothetical protein
MHVFVCGDLYLINILVPQPMKLLETQNRMDYTKFLYDSSQFQYSDISIIATFGDLPLNCIFKNYNFVILYTQNAT